MGSLTEGQIQDYQVPGPFSFVTYLKHILEPTTWGDQGLLTILSMMWQVTITILNAEDLSQIKIRHERPLSEVHLVVVLAQRCHYLGTCKFSFFLFCSFSLSFLSAYWCESVRIITYGVNIGWQGVNIVNPSVRMFIHMLSRRFSINCVCMVFSTNTVPFQCE